MPFLKTIVAFGLTGLTLVIITPFGVLAFVLSLIGLKKHTDVFIYKIAQVWARILIKCIGCPTSVIGEKNIPKTGPLCFVSNHGSIFDIVLILAFAGRSVGFVAKKELAWVPFIDLWILLIGGLFIDRKNVRKAIKTIEHGVQLIKGGNAMIIFPEGTRSRGRGLLPFHAGSLKLATQSEATIVPVAISGSYEVFEKNYRVQAYPVRIQFGMPIITTDIPAADRRLVLSEHIRTMIGTMLAEDDSNK
jgi:1-acyl-sn-glycerol-3-phosphate acyltransferase